MRTAGIPRRACVSTLGVFRAPLIAMDGKKTADFVTRMGQRRPLPDGLHPRPERESAFDEAWDTNGLQMQAFELLAEWAKAQNIENCKIELLKDAGHSAPHHGSSPNQSRLLLYAHIDKQPPMACGWRAWDPTIRRQEGKLYGRGRSTTVTASTAQSPRSRPSRRGPAMVSRVAQPLVARPHRALMRAARRA